MIVYAEQIMQYGKVIIEEHIVDNEEKQHDIFIIEHNDKLYWLQYIDNVCINCYVFMC